MKKIQFILMAGFVLGTCQLAGGAADELDIGINSRLSNNSGENGEVECGSFF